jgi:hypothetical protein
MLQGIGLDMHAALELLRQQVRNGRLAGCRPL